VDLGEQAPDPVGDAGDLTGEVVVAGTRCRTWRTDSAANTHPNLATSIDGALTGWETRLRGPAKTGRHVIPRE
jgi:hypothetical protein